MEKSSQISCQEADENINAWIQIICRKVIVKLWRIRWHELKLNKTSENFLQIYILLEYSQ